VQLILLQNALLQGVFVFNNHYFDLVVIGAELGRKNYGSIFHNCDWERAETI
jgi:hypothetical protein